MALQVRDTAGAECRATYVDNSLLALGRAVYRLAVAAMRAERQRLAAQANLYITGFLAAKVPMRRRG